VLRNHSTFEDCGFAATTFALRVECCSQHVILIRGSVDDVRRTKAEKRSGVVGRDLGREIRDAS
jgi:hypothetical protein